MGRGERTDLKEMAERTKVFFDGLFKIRPGLKEKCELCQITLAGVMAEAGAKAGSSERAVSETLAEQINEGKPENDHVTPEQLRGRARYASGKVDRGSVESQPDLDRGSGESHPDLDDGFPEDQTDKYSPEERADHKRRIRITATYLKDPLRTLASCPYTAEEIVRELFDFNVFEESEFDKAITLLADLKKEVMKWEKNKVKN